MKLRVFILTFALIVGTMTKAQDVLVKKDGTILTVYHLEEGSNSYFYSLEPSASATTQKIPKDEVFSVKINGTATTPAQSNETAKHQEITKHDPVTAQISSEIRVEKKGKFFSARTPDGRELNYQILSESDHTLAVVKGEYHEEAYIIPEYVEVGSDIYIVSEIGYAAFRREYKVRNIQFPTTLKIIRKEAFYQCGLERVLLPEGLEVIESQAFYELNRSGMFGNERPVNEIYIPSSVKTIGDLCFIRCGASFSYRGFCQEYFSNMPDFITEGNCKTFGIDEEAVRAFREKSK